MTDVKRGNASEADWELSEDYYQNDGSSELSLEDFMTEEEHRPGQRPFQTPEDELLAKTIKEVHLVLSLAGEGRSIDFIAEETGLDRQYVYNIQVCAQGFREDDEIAVAHLVLG